MTTFFSEKVVLVGNISSLGNWDPKNGLDLITTPEKYPKWFLQAPLKVLKNTILEFKFVVVKNSFVTRWEVLPAPKNRRYNVSHKKALLECFEGNYEALEIIRKDFLVKKMGSDKVSDIFRGGEHSPVVCF